MAVAAGARIHAEPAIQYQGWLSWITTVDHKRVGVLYGVTAFFFLLLGGLEALLIRIQLMQPNMNFVSAEFYNALFTMHGTTMIFLVIMPLSAAFFNYMVPLMIGARDVAFPRLNAFSYWTFLAGGVLLNLSWFFGAAPDIGWYAYANLTSKTYSPGLAVDFWMLSLQILGVASLAAAFNFIVTILNMRAPGMSLMRMPVFVWMVLVTNFLMIFAFPVITVALVELMFDRFIGTNFFNPAAGGDVLLWQHLFWAFGHPEVYILILPAMGIISEVLPTFSRKPLFGYHFVVFSGVAIGLLSFGVWAHHMFSVGMGPLPDAVFAINTMVIAVPTGVKIFNWIGTLMGGQIRFTTAQKFAIAFIAVFIVGGLSGVMHASPPADLQQTDTYFIVAHFHYVLVGGALFGLWAGFYYWFPKISGYMLSERIGTWNFWLWFVGFNLTFFPMHFTGLFGLPRRTYTYDAALNVAGFNLVSTIGAFISAFAVLAFMYNVWYSLRKQVPAGNDPWDGQTLEWATSSPPAPYNFAEVPHVTGRRPVWDAKYGEEHHDQPASPLPAREPVPMAGAVAVAEEHGPREIHIHMPNPSLFPFMVSCGIFIFAMGLIFWQEPWSTPVFALFGVLWTAASVFAWVFEPAG